MGDHDGDRTRPETDIGAARRLVSGGDRPGGVRRAVCVAVAAAMGMMGAVAAGPTRVAASTFTVTLSASATSVPAGVSVDLTATTNQDVGPTPWYLEIYDQTTTSLLASCGSGTVCTVPEQQTAAGTHTFVADVADWSSQYPPTNIQAESTPVTVTWQPWTLTLTGTPATPSVNQPATLTATANFDVGPTPFVIEIFDQSAGTGGLVQTCYSGSTCSALVNQSVPSSHTYVAYVAQLSSSAPPPGIEATSNTVTITWVVTGNVGGGPVAGTVSFSGNGVPMANTPCTTTSFSLSGTSAGAVLNVQGSEYVGAIALSGSGSGTCENGAGGSGSLTIAASGTNPATGATLACPSLTGTYVRTASDVTVVLTGSCTINSVVTGVVNFSSEDEFIPSNPGGGITTPVFAATFAGYFTITPG